MAASHVRSRQRAALSCVASDMAVDASSTAREDETLSAGDGDRLGDLAFNHQLVKLNRA